MRALVQVYITLLLACLLTGAECALLTTTLAIVKPEGWAKKALIEGEFLKHGFRVRTKTTMALQKDAATQFLDRHRQSEDFGEMVAAISDRPLAVFVLERRSAVAMLNALLGPANPEHAKTTAPETLRAKYGIDAIRNTIYSSPDLQAAQEDIEFFFENMASLDTIEDEPPLMHFDVEPLQLQLEDLYWLPRKMRKAGQPQDELQDTITTADMTNADIERLGKTEHAREQLRKERAEAQERLQELATRSQEAKSGGVANRSDAEGDVGANEDEYDAGGDYEEEEDSSATIAGGEYDDEYDDGEEERINAFETLHVNGELSKDPPSVEL